MPCQVPGNHVAVLAPNGLLSITNAPVPSLLVCLIQTHALDTSLSRTTCPGIPVIQAKPCQVEESLSQGGDRLEGKGGRRKGGDLQ